MATDSTHLLPGDTSIETDTDMSAGSSDLGSVQLAAATGDAPIPVNVPGGQQVIVVPVKPGQTIELPTDSVNGLLAKLGADGNLAIVVDGRTIILQGYAEANAESPIKIVTNDGDVVDVAEVIVATNPDIAIDIQTAAGPAAAGAQAGTDGAGSGIFVPFAAGALLGGFDAEGTLKATQLAYKNIDDDRVLFTLEEAGNNLPQDIKIVPDEGQPTGEGGSFLLDEDFLPPNSPGGNQDLPQPSPGDDAGSDTASGTVVVDFGLDGPRAIDPIVMSDVAPGTGSSLFALSGGADPTVPGGEILLDLDAPNAGAQVLHGVLNGVEYFRITLDTSTGHFVVEQFEPLFHDERNIEDNVFLDIEFTAFDSNLDELHATLHLDFDDDMPAIIRTDVSISLAVDESLAAAKSTGDFDDPNYATLPEDGTREEDDENLVSLPASLTNIAPVIGAAEADAAALFDVHIGADDFANTKLSQVYSLTILDADKDTGLTDTQTQDAIYLFDNNGVIEGRADDGDNNPDNDPVVFALTIHPFTGEISMAQYRAVDHGATEDPSALDEVTYLGLDNLAVTLTVVDGDGDKVANSVDLGNFVSFDDDHPTLTVCVDGRAAGGLVVELDETEGSDRYAPGEAPDGGNTDDAGPGLAQRTTDITGGLKALFLVGGSFGSDGPGTLTDNLSFGGFGGGDLDTNLEATDGGAIVLHLDSPTLIQGKDGDGDVVFTIEIVEVNPGEFQLQTTLFEALVHSDNTKFDESVQLLLEEGTVQLQYDVTRTDGDGDKVTASKSINLVTEEGSYFTFDDDGPSLTVTAKDASALAIELDETVGTDRAAPGETADGNTDDAGPGLGQRTTSIAGGLANLFTVGGDFGSDGPGALSDGDLTFLGFGGGDLATNLEATDGGAIILHLDSPTLIQGKDGDGDVVFTIEIVEVNPGEFQLQTTLFEALVHGDNAKFDESVQLLLEEGTVQLQYEVTRTDGDNDPITKSATVDLISDESSYFSFDDDGPTLTVGVDLEAAGGLAVELDETEGTDRAAPGETADGNTDDAGPGLGQKTTDITGGLKALFPVGGDFGSDGAGTLSDNLSFGGFAGGDLDTNLEATNGGAIVLHLDSATLIQGKDGDGDIVFTIEIVEVNPGEFQLQTTLFEALVHGDNAKFDESVQLLLDDGLVQLVYEATRTDDDGDPITKSASVDLISDESSYFTFDDDGPTLTVTPSTQGTAGLALELDETEGTDRSAPGEVADGNTDDAGPGLGQKTTAIIGGLAGLFSVVGDFGSDGKGSISDGILSFGGFAGGDLDSNLEATDGGPIVLHLDSPTLIQGKDGDGDVVFTIEIVEVNPGEFQLQSTLFEALVHGDNSKFDESVELMLEEGLVQLQYEVTITDGDGDPLTKSSAINLITEEGSHFTFDDDGPTLTVDVGGKAAAGLAVELDETVGTDRAAPGETADGNTDDVGPGLAQRTTDITGGLKALFPVGGDFGSDGAGTLTDKLGFGGFGGGDLDTNLEATDGGAIVLHLDSPTLIQGKDGDGDVVFTIAIVEVNPGEFQLQTTLFEALVHGDNAKFDESVQLLLEEGTVQLVYEATRTDGDGDPLTKSATIDLVSDESSYFTFDDDGPSLTVTAKDASALAIELDETVGTDRAAPGETADGNTDDAGPGLGQRTTSIAGGLANLFTVGGDFGSDGPGALSDGDLTFLGFGGGDLATNLEATDGGAIVLHLDSPTLIQGKDGDGDVVFTIEIVEVNPGEFQLQTTLFEALVHGDDAKFDESVQLLLEEGTVQLQYELTRTDGDNDPITKSATVDLISDESSYFSFDDDGPSLTVNPSTQGTGGLAVELDETVGTDRYAPGEAADGGNTDDAGPGLGQKTSAVPGGLKALFLVGGDFGSDGAGTLTDGLSFVGIPVGGLPTNLEATDGGAITLFANGNTLIEGKDTDGDIVFTIAIVDAGGGVLQLQTTLFEALVHDDNSKFDETVELLVTQGLVQLEYEVTRTDDDGDPITDSATIDLVSNEGSYFTFDDDGPSLTVNPSTQGTGGLAVELDETVGTDRAASGEVADGNTDDAGPGLGQKTSTVPGGLKALFLVGGDFGSDGLGTLTDKLSFGGFGGGDLATNLEATDGGAIVLHLDSPTLIQGKDGDGDVVFTIEIVEVNPGDFQLQTTLFEALVHGDNAKFDESVQLLLDNGLVQLVYEATRTDGDGDPLTKSATVDLVSDESSYFTFDDDGPTLTVTGKDASALAVELDETVGTDRAAPGETADGNTDDAGPGIGQRTSSITGGLANLFTVGGDFGSDGPGTLSDGTLSFLGFGGGDLDTNLEATDGGAIVLHLDSPTLIQGKDGDGDVVFTIEIVEVNPGEFQLQTTLFEALKHGDNSKFDEAVQLLLEEGTVQLKYEVTRTDGDNDPITKSATVDLISDESSYFTFDDDGPTAGTVVDPDILDDEGLTGGIKGGSGDAPGEFISTGGTLTRDFGSDGPGEVSFANLDGKTTTLGTETIDLSWDDGLNKLTGSSARGNIFTVVVDPLTGAYTFNLLDNVLHAKTAGENDATLSLAYQVTDGDGDKALGTVSFTIDDDTPVNFDPEDTIVSNVSGSSITGDLDVANHVGADGLAAVSPAIFTGIVSGVTQATGIINGASAELTSAGEDIILYLSADGSQVFGKIDGGATTVFTATLNAAGSDYTFQLNGTIDNGAGIVFDDFTGTTAGNEKWFGVINPDINGAPADPTDEDLLLTPINVDSINTNNTTIGVGNQSVTAGRGVKIDFVNNVTGDQDIAAGWSYDSLIEVNTGSFKIGQTSPNGSEVVVQVRAVSEVGTGTVFTDDTTRALTAASITVMNGGVQIFPAPGSRVQVYTMPDGTVVIDGLLVNDEIIVDSATSYNRLEVTNANGVDVGVDIDPGKAVDTTVDGKNFDLGAISILSFDAGSPIDLSFGVQITDGDGDTATGTVNVQLDPGGEAPINKSGDANPNTINGASGQDTLNGLDGADKINGDFGHDTLNGGDGNDTITGGGGNDVIDGGANNDAIAAGDGDDRVKYDAADGSVDGGISADDNLEHLGNLGDVLDVSGAVAINLGTAGAGTKLVGFETVDMTGGAGTALTLSAADVIALGTGIFNPEGDLGAAGTKDAIKIVGDVSDSVNLTGGGWFDVTSQVSDPPVGFKVYAHDSDGDGTLTAININAYVLVENDITNVTGVTP